MVKQQNFLRSILHKPINQDARKRRKVTSAVLTDTPIKDEIAGVEANRKAKNVKHVV